jgi:putative spermidine/putrescine transport system permease protein
MRFGARFYLLLVLPGALLLVLVAGLVQLIASSLAQNGGFSLGYYQAFFQRPDYVDMLIRTLGISALTAFICLLLGYPAAWFVARYKGRRDWLLVMIILPWALSLIVRTFGWIVLLGNKGVINAAIMATGLTDRPVMLMFNTLGVVIGLVHAFCPFMILAILSSFMHLDGAYEEASMSLRAGKLQTFLRVVLPLTMPGVMSGLILVYLMATGSIVTPLMLGGVRDGFLGTQMYSDVIDMSQYAKAASFAVILAIAAIVVVVPLQWVERRVSRHLKSAEG